MHEAATFYMENIKNGNRSQFENFQADTVANAQVRMDEAVTKMNLGDLIFDKEEVLRLKDVLLRYYIDLKGVFAYSAARSPAYPGINYDDAHQILIAPLVEEDDDGQHEQNQ